MSAAPAAAAPPDLPPEQSQIQRVQAIRCGPYWLGFVYGWARAVVEDAPITPVPNAPDWLLGAANVAGHIVPVVDLASWAGAAPNATPNATPNTGGARLLLGGQGADQLALRFDGLPQPLLWQSSAWPGEAAHVHAPPDLPEALAALAVAHLPLPETAFSERGSAHVGARVGARVCSVLAAQALLEALLATLSNQSLA